VKVEFCGPSPFDSALELHSPSGMGDTANKLTSAPVTPAVNTRRGSSSSRVIGMLLFVGAVVGGSILYVQQHDRNSENERTVDTSRAPKYIVHLEGFTVNLADPEETHFLRATIDLGMDRLPPGADKDKIAQSVPVARIRDSILSVLTVCRANDLLTPEGKAQLKKKLIETLNKNVPEIGLREIYFTEFLVQR